IFYFFFFFQAEDGIRVFHVTGVQTCALPILFGWPGALSVLPPLLGVAQTIVHLAAGRRDRACAWDVVLASLTVCLIVAYMAYWRSEERRVGKECRNRQRW